MAQSPLSEVLSDIRRVSESCGRTDIPQLMAVSKTHPVERIVELYGQGQRIFGENYVQELIEKKAELEKLNRYDADLHFIGHLQTNKVKQLLPAISTLHSVDSFRLLQEVEKRAEELQKKIFCYFQINIDDEVSKGGFAVEELDELAERASACRWATPTGLMCIPNPDLDPGAAFHRMKILSEKYSPSLGAGLSMGMSDDYAQAIEAGATIVRVGSKLFGARKKV